MDNQLNRIPEILLMGPGPSCVSASVYNALAQPTLGHLDPAFITLMDDIKKFLKKLMGTTNELTVPISGTGSAGMEACFVNLIEPGWIDTPGERNFSTDEEIKAGAADLPWKRLGTPEEIGNGVLYLASDMGSYVSGETLRIDAATWLPRAIDRL